MITNVPIFFSLLLNNNYLFCSNTKSLLFIGFYYGFLSSFSLTISHLLCLRIFLLDKVDKNFFDTISQNRAVIASISGFIFSQFILFLSIYWQPLSFLWYKPHISILFGFFYMFSIWNRTKDFQRSDLNSNFYDSNFPLSILFFDNFFFSICNCFVLPNPILNRLMTILFFRYSHIILFSFGAIIGWLSGQVMFLALSWLLVIRLQNDMPGVYRITKRLVHNLFSIILFISCLFYLGKLPVVTFTKLSKNLSQETKVSSHSILPTMGLWNHSPYRITRENNTNQKNFFCRSKKYSQYFFDLCVNQGKQRLSSTCLNSLFQFHRKLNICLNGSTFFQKDSQLYNTWAQFKKNRYTTLRKILRTKIRQLDKGNRIEDVIQNKYYSNTHNNQIVNLKLDPRFNNLFRGITLTQTRKPWVFINSIFQESSLTNLQSNVTIKKFENTEFQKWLSNKLQKNNNKLLLPFNVKERFDLTRFKNDEQKLDNTIFKISNKMFFFNKQTSYFLIDTSNDDSKVHIPGGYQQIFDQIKNPSRRVGLRAKRRKALIWDALQYKTASPFLLRIRIKTPNRFETFFKVSSKKTTSLTIQKEKQNSDILAKKFNKWQLHVLRTPALVIQSFFRKYIKLPFLIIFKNCAHFLINGKTNWNQDFINWSSEKYLIYTYDSTSLVRDSLPKIYQILSWLQYIIQLFRKGCQIKIKDPFQLEPWNLPRHQLKASFLTVSGNETDRPFGNKIENYSFRKPFLKIIRILFEKNINTSHLKIQKFDFQMKKKVHQKFDPKQKAYLEKSDMMLEANKKSKTYLSVKENQLAKIRKKKEQLKKQNNNLLDQVTNLKQKISTKKSGISKNLQHNGFKLDKKSLLILNRSQHSFFSFKFISNKFYIYLQSKKLQINTFLNKFQKNYAFWFLDQILFYQNVFSKTTKFVSQSIKTGGEKCKDIIILLIRNKNNFLDFVISQYYFLKKSLLREQNSYVFDKIKLTENKLLTQAYVFHKIWQIKTANSFQLTYTLNLPQENLTNKIGTFVFSNGILKKTTIDLRKEHWHKWLESLPYYKPSYFFWSNLFPSHWGYEVNLKASQKENSSKKAQNTIDDHYYEPLLQQTQKLLKRWKVQMFFSRYTIFADLFSNFKEKSLDKNHQEKGKLFKKTNQSDSSINQIETNTFYEDNQWGFQNTKIKRFSPLLKYEEVPNSDEVLSEKIQKGYDDYFMRHLINSTFQLLEPNFKESISGIIFTSEEILLSQTIRELRTLNLLNLKKDLDNSQNKLKTKTIFKNNNISQSFRKQKQMKRFLWPSYRFEDLACMNRFWFQIANQSRFLSLHTSMYPLVYF